jgi:hypothetical protein
MSNPSTDPCANCGAGLPQGRGGADGVCPVCGQPTDPDRTLRPGVVPPGALTRVPPLDLPPLPDVELPARLPLAPIVFLAVVCALMGVGLGLWLRGRWQVPPARADVRLPALPPLGPGAAPAPSATALYPPPAAPAAPPPLPPARVTPPVAIRERPEAGGPRDRRWAMAPRPARPAAEGVPAPPASSDIGPPPDAAMRAPLKAPGMATLHVANSSAKPVHVTMKGTGEQVGVIGPHATVDFLVSPGRYDVTLHGGSRTQRFYDAPLAEGEVLDLVYTDRASG